MDNLKLPKEAIEGVLNSNQALLNTASTSMVYQLNVNCTPGTANVIALISTREGEGTTYCATAILEALPQLLGNVSALLVDANIYHTDLSSQLGSPERGWAHWIKNKNAYSIRDAVMPWKNLTDISVLPIGAHSNTEDKHYLTQLIDAITLVKANFDFILIDCPPFFRDKLANLFCACSGNILVVIEAENTRKYLVKKMVEELQNMDLKILGAILNKRRYHIPRWIYDWLF